MHAVLVFDGVGRFQQRAEQILGLFLGIQLGEVGAEVLSFAVQAVAGDAVGRLKDLLAHFKITTLFQR